MLRLPLRIWRYSGIVAMGDERRARRFSGAEAGVEAEAGGGAACRGRGEDVLRAWRMERGEKLGLGRSGAGGKMGGPGAKPAGIEGDGAPVGAVSAAAGAAAGAAAVGGPCICSAAALSGPMAPLGLRWYSWPAMVGSSTCPVTCPAVCPVTWILSCGCRSPA